jgi:hypothetical protein
MSSTHADDASSFEAKARAAFAFLEQECGATFTGVHEIKADPRDSGLVARYKGADWKIDIGWSKLEQSLAVLIHLKRDDLPRSARYVYLESFVEYVSGGSERPIVAQIYPRMSEDAMTDAIKGREQTFERQQLPEVLAELSAKLRQYLGRILDASSDEIQFYHRWLERSRP